MYLQEYSWGFRVTDGVLLETGTFEITGISTLYVLLLEITFLVGVIFYCIM